MAGGRLKTWQTIATTKFHSMYKKPRINVKIHGDYSSRYIIQLRHILENTVGYILALIHEFRQDNFFNLITRARFSPAGVHLSRNNPAIYSLFILRSLWNVNDGQMIKHRCRCQPHPGSFKVCHGPVRELRWTVRPA